MKKDPLIYVFAALALIALATQFPAYANEEKRVNIKLNFNESKQAHIQVQENGNEYEVTLSPEAMKDEAQLEAELAHLPKSIQDELTQLFQNQNFDDHEHRVALAIDKAGAALGGKKIVEIIKEAGEGKNHRKIIVKKLGGESAETVVVKGENAHFMHIADAKSLGKGSIKTAIVSLIQESDLSQEDKAAIRAALDEPR